MGAKVFIPVALAVFLTFLLAHCQVLPSNGAPGENAGGPCRPVAGLVLSSIGWLITAEVKSLAAELPAYTKNIKLKIRSLKQMDPGSITDRLDTMIQEITGAWQSPSASPEDGAEGEPAAVAPAKLPVAIAPEKLPTMVPQPDSPPWLARLPAVLGPMVETLGGLALVFVLVVFMLLKREDLRNRLIRLVGHGRLTVTTKAVDDAGQRISRFLLMQFIVNVSYGLALTVGLFAIQVPNALLWGFMAALLRYVPYLGTAITSVALMMLSLAAFPGWLQPLLVLGLLGVLELVTYNVMEPWLFSHSTGVSEVAVLVSAAFWAFLWGPVGLVLSNPLTVCLVVLGKYVDS